MKSFGKEKARKENNLDMQNESTPIFIIRWSEACNNRCIMCSFHGGDTEMESVPFENILKQLDNGRKIHQRVEFTGGEPTVRPRLDEAIAHAKKIGYTFISLSTNGRLLADNEFCKKLVKNGLTSVTIAVHGHDAETHDAITRTKGSFDEILLAVKNLKELKTDVSIASVISKKNFNNFEKIGDLFLSLGVESWNVSDIMPDGRGRDIYERLALSPRELMGLEKRIIPVLKKFLFGGVFNFSRCVFPKDISQCITFFDSKKKFEGWDMEGKANRCSKENGVYKDAYKRNIPECDKCRFSDTCGGFWDEYLDIYGIKATSEIAKKSGLLK